MYILIDNVKISFDTKNIFLTEIELDIETKINLLPDNIINEILITLHDDNSTQHLIQNYYNNKDIKIYKNNELIFIGKITGENYNNKIIQLNCTSSIDLLMNSYLDYQTSSKNPVQIVKEIIDLIDNTLIDTTSYTSILALFTTKLCLVSYQVENENNKLNDEKSYKYAINEICKLLNFYIYWQNGKFYFYDFNTYSKTQTISRDFIEKPLFSVQYPDYTKLYIEWEGGSALSEYSGNIAEYGTIEKSMILSDANNIIFDNETYLDNTIQDNINFNSYKQIYIEFTGLINLNFSDKILLKENNINVYFRLISKKYLSGNKYYYKGILT